MTSQERARLADLRRTRGGQPSMRTLDTKRAATNSGNPGVQRGELPPFCAGLRLIYMYCPKIPIATNAPTWMGIVRGIIHHIYP